MKNNTFQIVENQSYLLRVVGVLSNMIAYDEDCKAYESDVPGISNQLIHKFYIKMSQVILVYYQYIFHIHCISLLTFTQFHTFKYTLSRKHANFHSQVLFVCFYIILNHNTTRLIFILHALHYGEYD